MLAKALGAVMGKHGIRVNAIEPGAELGGSDHAGADLGAQPRGIAPIDGGGDPHVIAADRGLEQRAAHLARGAEHADPRGHNMPSDLSSARS
jgi:NAD(P)-dependent dehydrogenase (short-subunit alcohol dehydrogenase family)